MSVQRIINRGDLKKWRTEIPNLYDDIVRDPYCFRLLVHYVRVGVTWENTETTAQKCGMSTGQVVKCREKLEHTYHLVSLGWHKNKNSKPSRLVKVLDIWEQNFRHFSKKKRESSRGELSGRVNSPGERQSSPGTIKERTNEERTREYVRKAHSAVRSQDGYRRKREPHFQGTFIDRVKALKDKS